eukprot:TRINITY_DN19771_c0_g3_i1.p1 TRINITY_DN19771_c0_g3~~TRINITY_DN19771_c0_g3_i1.p1  ORF type:complete len:309 (-),score=59.20 TRINITY_DN19771_c0_g3_i1:94-993(-)
MLSEAPPDSLLAVLCPTAWTPEECRGRSDAGKEDYCVCLLKPSDRLAAHALPTSFPGGPVEVADMALARANLKDEEDTIRLALRITALRRTFESAGMVIAGTPPPNFAREELQKILARDGALAFHAFLNDWGVRLRPESLTKLAFFMPTGRTEAGQQTHVFLARVPGVEEVSWASACAGKAQDLLWVTPSGALLMHEEGELYLPSTQRYVLAELAEQLPSLQGLPDLLGPCRRRPGPLWGPPLRTQASRADLVYCGLPIPRALYSPDALGRRMQSVFRDLEVSDEMERGVAMRMQSSKL